MVLGLPSMATAGPVHSSGAVLLSMGAVSPVRSGDARGGTGLLSMAVAGLVRSGGAGGGAGAAVDGRRCCRGSP